MKRRGEDSIKAYAAGTDFELSSELRERLLRIPTVAESEISVDDVDSDWRPAAVSIEPSETLFDQLLELPRKVVSPLSPAALHRGPARTAWPVLDQRIAVAASVLLASLLTLAGVEPVAAARKLGEHASSVVATATDSVAVETVGNASGQVLRAVGLRGTEASEADVPQVAAGPEGSASSEGAVNPVSSALRRMVDRVPVLRDAAAQNFSAAVDVSLAYGEAALLDFKARWSQPDRASDERGSSESTH